VPLAALALRYRLPGMFPFKENVVAGGLMSYGADPSDLYRRAAAYVDKILKGAKPADLPVEQASKYELVVNLKTAKAVTGRGWAHRKMACRLAHGGRHFSRSRPSMRASGAA
jgi:hypothetical protein